MFGYTHTADTKALMSESKAGENHPMYGKTHTAEAKALMSVALQGNTNRLGSTHTAETKAAISAALSGRTLSAETKALMSERNSGENNHFFGKTHTTESIDHNRINQPNRKSVYVYDMDSKLVGKFLSQSEAAKFLNCNASNVSRNVDTGKRLRKIYQITTCPLP
jgi:group I intron endonuclease